MKVIFQLQQNLFMAVWWNVRYVDLLKKLFQTISISKICIYFDIYRHRWIIFIFVNLCHFVTFCLVIFLIKSKLRNPGLFRHFWILSYPETLRDLGVGISKTQIPGYLKIKPVWHHYFISTTNKYSSFHQIIFFFWNMWSQFNK